jgi:hypothetical protein
MNEIKIFEDLLGKELSGITVNGALDEIIFHVRDHGDYKLYHPQDCCENVNIDDINGNLSDLLNSPITLAQEISNTEKNPEGVIKEYQDSFTWTFYKLATVKGFVDIRWYGESNGYYSESVDFVKA